MSPRIRIASAASVLFLPAAAASAQLTNDIVTGSFQIGLEQVTNTGGPPLDLTHAGDGTNRLFIAGQNTGDVRLFKNGALVSTPFLDLNGTGTTGAGLPLAINGERGLLGIAFHPNFAAAGQPGFGRFYTYTSETKGANFSSVDYIHDELDGTDASPLNNGDHDSVIREWTVNPSNPDQVLINTADRPSSGREVLRIRQPQSNHNGGAIKFGPDGMLYIAMGDGGGANDNQGGMTNNSDGHTNNTGNAQDINNYTEPRNLNVLGKILRIDPRLPDPKEVNPNPISENEAYRIPANNPFIGPTAGADEIFAYGLRNPFRMSFDRVGGGLYVGDVGQGQREEIDLITSGGNYGWVYREGTRTNVTPPGGFISIAPIGEYTHSDGQAVIGGFVYRGHNIPELYGKYVFGELAWDDPATTGVTEQGRIFYMDGGGGTINEFQYLLNPANTSQLYGFGEDRDGELYAMFADGNVRKLVGRQWYATTGGSWGTGGNWLGTLPNAVGAAANFVGRGTGASTAQINLDGSRTVGSLLFNDVDPTGAAISYRIAQGSGGGTLNINNGTPRATVKVVNGSHEIAAPVAVASGTDIDVAAGGSLKFANTVTLAAGRSISKTGAGTASFSGGLTMASTAALSVGGGVLNVRNINGGESVAVNNARLNVLPDGGPNGTSKVISLQVINGGRLDLSNNKFIVSATSVGTSNGSTYSGLTGLIQQGHNGGAWNGTGIMTSGPDAATGLTAIGIATAAQIGRAGSTFSGVSVAAGDAIMMYTYAGDANLDGAITGDDYSTIDFNIAVPGAHGWFNGDFNYDGVVSGDDYSVIDFNFVAQGTPFSTSSTGTNLVAVPEPSACGFAGLAAAGLLRRRRRLLR